MSEDSNKLQTMLEQVTAAGEVPDNDLDPNARSLRESWIDFGRLLDAAQPVGELKLDPKKALRSVPSRRWLWSSAALVAASLLIGVAMTWMTRETDQPQLFPSTVEQTASALDEPQWDDTLDEQIAQVGWQMIYARQDVYSTTAGGSVQYGIEQMQKELAENNL